MAQPNPYSYTGPRQLARPGRNLSHRGFAQVTAGSALRAIIIALHREIYRLGGLKSSQRSWEWFRM
jgi:hypothetical protein